MTKPRVYVELTALWCNGDAESTVKMSRLRWDSIVAGAAYSTAAWSWYEGRRKAVEWSFTNGKVSIDGEDGMQCIVDMSVDELVGQIVSAGKEPK
jgi:hypothetical protein